MQVMAVGEVDPWPLRRLVLRTPRLELRPDDDEGLLELVEATYAGIHDPDWMPFGVPWTRAPQEVLGRNTLQFYWGQRASLRASAWVVNFLVRLDGRVIGNQGISGDDFAFDRLGALTARSDAWLDNAASLGVSRKLGYEPDGVDLLVRGERTRDRMQRLVVTAERFAEHRPKWTVEVDGLTQQCMELLGV